MLEKVSRFLVESKPIRSVSTLKSYSVYLSQYVHFCAGESMSWEDPRALARWLSALTRAGKRNGYTCISCFFAWAVQEGLCSRNPATALPRPRPHRPLVYRPLEQEEITRLLDLLDEDVLAARVRPRWKLASARLRLVMLLMLGLGLRPGEVLGITTANLDLKGRRLLVRRKGGDMVQLEIGEALLPALSQWVGLRASVALPDEPALIVSWSGSGITAQELRDEFASLCKRSGVKLEKGGLQQLRHASASWLLRQGKNISEIASYLGHHSLTSTDSYLRYHFGSPAKSGQEILVSLKLARFSESDAGSTGAGVLTDSPAPSAPAGGRGLPAAPAPSSFRKGVR